MTELDVMLRSRDAMHRNYLAAVDNLARWGAVSSVPIDSLRWCEIDVPGDLVTAALMRAPDTYPVEVARRGAAAG